MRNMKRTKITLLILGFVFIGISCKKEKFPDLDDIRGVWVEKTDSRSKMEMWFFDDQTLFWIHSNQSLDTLYYELDKKEKLLWLGWDSPLTNHSILWDKKKDELTIWNLFSSIPEGPQSETIFKKK